MPWYRIILSANDVNSARVVQLIGEFVVLRATHGNPRYAHIYIGQVDGCQALFLSPDCADFAAEFIKKYGAAESTVPAVDSAKPCTGPFEIAETLLRAPALRQLVEQWLRTANFMVSVDGATECTSWDLIVTPPGRRKSIAICRMLDNDSVLVQMIFMLDSVQKRAWGARDSGSMTLIRKELVETLGRGGSNFQLFAEDVLSRDDQLGMLLFRTYREIPSYAFTLRNLLESISTVLDTFDLGERFAVDRLGQGIRNRPP
jgi:hypothetical protein